jgi:hypothetical protein
MGGRASGRAGASSTPAPDDRVLSFVSVPRIHHALVLA